MDVFNNNSEGFQPVSGSRPRRVFRPEWLARFRQDAETHLVEILQGLQALTDQAGLETGEEAEQEQPVLRELFRHAHSLKGAALMLEQTAIAEVAADLETILREAWLEPARFSEAERAKVGQQVNYLRELVAQVKQADD